MQSEYARPRRIHASAHVCVYMYDAHHFACVHEQAKAEKLIKALGNERNNRIQKEKMFVELLQEERTARLQVCARAYLVGRERSYIGQESSNLCTNVTSPA